MNKEKLVNVVCDVVEQFKKLKRYSVNTGEGISVYPSSNGPFVEYHDVKKLCDRLKFEMENIEFNEHEKNRLQVAPGAGA